MPVDDEEEGKEIVLAILDSPLPPSSPSFKYSSIRKEQTPCGVINQVASEVMTRPHVDLFSWAGLPGSNPIK